MRIVEGLVCNIGSSCINTRDMAVQVVDGKLSAGQLSSFVIYALYVGTNVGALAGVISNLIQVSTRTLHLYFFMRPATLNVFACYPWMRVEFFWGCSYGIWIAALWQAVGASRRVFELLDRHARQKPSGNEKPMGSPEGGEIVFDNVWCTRITQHAISIPHITTV